MGEKDETKKADAGGKKDEGPPTVVLKLDLHCQGCAKKIKRSIRHFEGVERVKADSESNKLTVTGKVDPTRLRERLEYKTKKKVELLSPQPKNTGDKKSNENKQVEPQESTVVMKIRLHCDGCIHKIKRIISKTDGVRKVTADLQKDLVTIVGTMNLKELIPSLKEKLKRSVEIVPAKKDDKGGEKKEGGGEKKKEGESKAATSGGDGGKSGDAKGEVKKMEYYGHSPNTYTIPAYNHNYFNQDYGVSTSNHDYVSHGYVNHGYIDHGYVMEYSQPPPPPPPMYFHDPYVHQMFSEENPNGCFVM
ncbi:hypothetical protein LguiA_032309 [Lonicera macranthoides]